MDENGGDRGNINEEKGTYLCKKQQGCLEEDAHGLGPAPEGGGGRVAGLSLVSRWSLAGLSLVSEMSGAGQSRAESSRGVLLGVYFLHLMIMMITIPVPRRFRFEAGAPMVVESVLIFAEVASRGAGGLGGGLCWRGGEI